MSSIDWSGFFIIWVGLLILLIGLKATIASRRVYLGSYAVIVLSALAGGFLL